MIFGRLVLWEGAQDIVFERGGRRLSTSESSEWLAAGETGFDLMPPVDAVFAQLPAEIHLTPMKQSGESLSALRSGLSR